MSKRAALAACALGVGLFACGTATVDGESVADDIQAEFEERTGVASELVSCPETIRRAKGETFECTALVGETTAIVKGTMTDNAGAFDWEPARDIVDGEEVTAQILSELGEGVVVTCDPVIFADPGDPFTCEATEPGGAPVTILVTPEEDGSFTWSVEAD